MNYKDNKIIDVDFTEKENEYYIVFRNPKNEIIRIDNIHKIELIRVNEDAVELKIESASNKIHIYHYVNDLITLLDDLDIGFE